MMLKDEVPVAHGEVCIRSYNPVVVAGNYQHLSWVHWKPCRF